MNNKLNEIKSLVRKLIKEEFELKKNIQNENALRKWDDYSVKSFKKWVKDGNVIKNPDGTYSTQDAQYNNRLDDIDALKLYFQKEFLTKDNFINENSDTKYYDLFEYFEKQPPELKKIVDEWSPKLEQGLTYNEVSEFLRDVESVGYTFDSYLDAEPYGLRPIGVELNQLVGWEDINETSYSDYVKTNYDNESSEEINTDHPDHPVHLEFLAKKYEKNFKKLEDVAKQMSSRDYPNTIYVYYFKPEKVLKLLDFDLKNKEGYQLVRMYKDGKMIGDSEGKFNN